MSDDAIPFLAQVAILDRYIHMSEPLSDPEAVDIIINVLMTKPELRAYFFRSSPNSAWVPILWEKGFFTSPPSPENQGQGYTLPFWDAQYYLISVASDVPQIVLKHVETITGHSWYISQALKALCSIPTDMSEKVVQRIIDWLNNPDIAEGISDEVIKLIEHFIQDKKFHEALLLFRPLTAPGQPSNRQSEKLKRDQWSRKIDDRIFGTDLDPSEYFYGLKKERPAEVIEILENHLLVSLRQEADEMSDPNLEIVSWWRNAIEDSEQDDLNSYNNRILQALRDTLIAFKDADPGSFTKILLRYLSAHQSIFRRLGLFILHQYPATYRDFVASELLKRQNIDDTTVHHEYFLLLQNGYPHLTRSEKQILVSTILEGPDARKTQELAEWANVQYKIDPNEYARKHINAWIRDRLWMIRDFIDNTSNEILSKLISDGGTPNHPDYLVWSSDGFLVQEVSPYTEADLAGLAPTELISLLINWHPDPLQQFGPEEVSYSELAKVVAKLILPNIDKYLSGLFQIASIRPEFTTEIFAWWINAEKSPTVPWQVVIDLINNLQYIDDFWVDHPSTGEKYFWRYVRFSIVQLLKIGVTDQTRKLPPELLPNARDILIKLTSDPDPDEEADRPPEGYLGHNNPIDNSLNHVRPMALSALIEYAWVRYLDLRKEQGFEGEDNTSFFEGEVISTLEQKLDKAHDSSRAVHSIFGRYLIYLYHLDKKWLENNLHRIFPLSNDEESVWYYISVWDSYLFYNRFQSQILNLLRPYYKQAINNISQGHVIKSHIDTTNYFTIHIAFEYLASDYDLNSPQGETSLIVEFFKTTSPETRNKAAWAIWRICIDQPARLSQFWSRARAIWQWRTNEALVSNHSPDFNDEMEEFAKFPLIAPETEKLSTLRPLMEALLSHIGKNEYRNPGWDSIEKYLSKQVEKDPVEVINFYRLMYDRRTIRPRWFFHTNESRKIIEVAAGNPHSREGALALIDLFARWGDYEFRNIHDRYSH